MKNLKWQRDVKLKALKGEKLGISGQSNQDNLQTEEMESEFAYVQIK